jgi:hypothetical protein
MVRTKSGSERAVRPECVIRGVLFHPTRLKGSLLNKYIEQSFIKVALFPARHREALARRAGLCNPLLGACQVERRQRGVEMAIQCGFGTPLAGTQASELFAVTEQKLALETRPLQLHQLAAVQGQSRGGPHDIARLGWGFLVDHAPEP